MGGTMAGTIHDQMSKPIVPLDPNAPLDPNVEVQKDAAAAPAAPVVEEPKIEKPPEEAKPAEAVETAESADTAEGGEANKAGSARSGTPGAKGRPGSDASRSEFQGPSPHENFGKLPQQFGHRINTNAQVAQQNQGAEGRPPPNAGPQQGPRPGNLPPGMRPLGAGFDGSQTLSREAARALLNDPVFRGPLKDSPLHNKLRAQAMGDQALRQGQIAREAGSESLKRGDVGQLFRMRHQIQEKDQLKILVHGEIAKLKEQAKQKVQAIRYQTESHDQGEEKIAARLAKMGNADGAKQELAKRLSQMGGESDFEQTLQKFLAGEKSVPDLPEGVRARFAAKSDAEWEVFFKNASNLNSAEVASKGNLSKMVDALFRGLFHKASAGKSVMVSDLTLAEEGAITTNKFAQIPISDDSLAALFKQLMPGDVINRDMLQKLGQEFDLIRLVHLAEAAVVLSETQRQQVLREFRQQRSLEGQRNFEKALIQSRGERDEQEKADRPFPSPAPDLEKLEPRLGQQRFFMYMLYGIIAITVVLVLFLVIRSL